MLTVAVFVLVFVAALCRAQDALSGRVPRLMSEGDVTGLSVAVVHNGRLTWKSGFGVRSVACPAVRSPVSAPD